MASNAENVSIWWRHRSPFKPSVSCITGLKRLTYCPACGTSDLGLTASAPLLLWWEFSFYLGFRALDRSLVKKCCNIHFFIADQIMISHINRKLSSRIIWDIVAWSDDSFSFKKQNIFYEIWSISSPPSVEWSPATTGRVDADILNGSCDVWGITWFSALYSI